MSNVRFSNGIVRAVSSLICLLFLKACVPSEEEKLASAERRRIECLDQFCEGDIDPRLDTSSEALLKIYGQWYVGPKKYFVQQNAAQFFWPLKQRGAPGSADDEGEWDLVEIFLTGVSDGRILSETILHHGRAVIKKSLEERMRRDGFRMEQISISNDLYRRRFFDQKNRPYRLEYYYFKSGKWPLGQGVVNTGCEFPSQDDLLSRCTGGGSGRKIFMLIFGFRRSMPVTGLLFIKKSFVFCPCSERYHHDDSKHYRVGTARGHASRSSC